jgi:metallo-beta-lactamase superfamily protein
MAKRPPRRRAKSRAAPRSGRYRAKIRMYRQGLGDCFLITLPRTGRAGGRRPYYIMIDCGVILGTENAADKMAKVVDNIVADTNGEIDLLVVTHEHFDHVSGFVQAQESFKNLKVHEVWLAWTENPRDRLAQKLRADRDSALASLRLAVAEFQLAGDAQSAEELGGVLEFFGAAKGASTKDALEFARKLTPGKPPRYCLPKGEDNPIRLNGANVDVYVLGPPHDEKQLRKINPSKRARETYGLALAGLDLFVDGPGAALAAGSDDPDRPFNPVNEIPFTVAREMDFFKQRYWSPKAADEDWRRIDTAWLQGAPELALQLDSLTNNTSLALAIELADGDVLLFVADAQVGNWLSWQDLAWDVKKRKVTGPGLLEKAIFYKVGHHASHNATLKEKGLELMKNLRVAMIPVDEVMAKKKRWNHMPLPELVKELAKQTNGAVVRADKPLPQTDERLEGGPNNLYYELTL